MSLQILEALEFMHGKQVIHRDVKPANIMRCGAPPGAVYKLIDLSIAAVELGAGEGVSQTMQTGTTGLAALVGTPHYMSPEQFQEGQVVTHQTDLWSLGVVMFTLLTGACPFAPEDQAAYTILYAIRNASVAGILQVSRRDAQISTGVSEIICKALEKELRARYASAAEMAEAIKTAAQLPAHWVPMDARSNCVQVPLPRTEDPTLWERVEERISDSLPDFDLLSVERVQNLPLWRKYST